MPKHKPRSSENGKPVFRRFFIATLEYSDIDKAFIYVDASFKSSETVFSDDPYPLKSDLTIGF
ncbi:hypothetical protein [Neisseria sicca]|uniref:hypothetical protein n=1 Tax=Neisseria sicca TaxID=490 RepID=UPI0021C20369|nr:hypothetical protein [Neisseria sicca]